MEDLSKPPKKSSLFVLMIAALGVVYGDIGTSPLYAFRMCFHAMNGIPINQQNILGILSLITWSLILIICIKYIFIIMRADNKGEGGVLVLMTLFQGKGSSLKIITFFGFIGAALLFGDGLITPSISVLSAVEGLNVAFGSSVQPFVVPIALIVLISLFTIQRKGTSTVGGLFGPIMLFWFFIIAFLGIVGITNNPFVLKAINPYYAIEFFVNNKLQGFFTLSSVFLALTGGEALYADMGHFGRTPIQRSWFIFVFPALLLNYYGQGAHLLMNPENIDNLFYRLAPEWTIVPMVILATVATVIASQAIISGVFSMSRQAMQLDICPRFEIVHTSDEKIGQVYVPVMNWILFIGTILLVIGFKDSGKLASAYGVAVATTMLITTFMIFPIMIKKWKWHPFWAVVVIGFFVILNGAFFASNLIKIFNSGWISVLVAVVIYSIIMTWRHGRSTLRKKLALENIDEELFLEDVKITKPKRVDGTAVFFTGDSRAVPKALLHNFKHNQILHKTVVFLTVKTEEVPYVDEPDKVVIKELGAGFYRIIIKYGFSEDPNIPYALEKIKYPGLKFITTNTTFFLGRITLLADDSKSRMPIWQRLIFSFLSRNSSDMWKYFHIPPNRVIEVGAQIEL